MYLDIVCIISRYHTFFCLDRQIDKESIFFTLFLVLAYCLVMNIWKINVIEHYKVINYKVISDKYLHSF